MTPKDIENLLETTETIMTHSVMPVQPGAETVTFETKMEVKVGSKLYYSLIKLLTENNN